MRSFLFFLIGFSLSFFSGLSFGDTYNGNTVPSSVSSNGCFGCSGNPGIASSGPYPAYSIAFESQVCGGPITDTGAIVTDCSSSMSGPADTVPADQSLTGAPTCTPASNEVVDSSIPSSYTYCDPATDCQTVAYSVISNGSLGNGGVGTNGKACTPPAANTASVPSTDSCPSGYSLVGGTNGCECGNGSSYTSSLSANTLAACNGGSAVAPVLSPVPSIPSTTGGSPSCPTGASSLGSGSSLQCFTSVSVSNNTSTSGGGSSSPGSITCVNGVCTPTSGTSSGPAWPTSASGSGTSPTGSATSGTSSSNTFSSPSLPQSPSIGDSTNSMMSAIENSDLIQSADGVTIPSGGTCPTPSFTVFGQSYQFTQFCSLANDSLSPLKYIFVAGWALLALFIALSA